MSNKLEVKFLGRSFLNPFILASAPPTRTRDMIERAFESGWGGAIIKTLAYNLEQTQNVRPRIVSVKRGKSIVGFNNCELGSTDSVDLWLENIRKIKANYPDNILLASLLHTEGLVESQWKEVALKCGQAGIDGFELNFSCPHGMAESGGGSAIGDNENLIEQVIGWVREVSLLPIMVKFNALARNIEDKVKIVKASGADAVSGINSMRSLNGIDIYNFVPYPQVDGASCYSGLSGVAIKPFGLRFISQIASQVEFPLSGIGGVSSWHDAVEYILAGATTLQVCSGVMEKGYDIINNLNSGLMSYMEKMNFEKISDFVGLAVPNIKMHNQLPRNKKVFKVDEQKCTGCGACVASCRDSAYQSISMEENKAVIDRDKCDGCGLCASICPVAAISLL